MAFIHPVLSHLYYLYKLRKTLEKQGIFSKPRKFYMQEIGEWRDD